MAAAHQILYDEKQHGWRQATDDQDSHPKFAPPFLELGCNQESRDREHVREAKAQQQIGSGFPSARFAWQGFFRHEQSPKTRMAIPRRLDRTRPALRSPDGVFAVFAEVNQRLVVVPERVNLSRFRCWRANG